MNRSDLPQRPGSRHALECEGRYNSSLQRGAQSNGRRPCRDGFSRVILLAALLIFLVSSPVFSDITDDIQKLAELFSLDFRDNNPNLVFKPNLGIIPFTNDSPDAEKYRIGEAVTEIIERSFTRSLIFNVIDERQREKVLKEIQFALSGLSDTDRVEIGRLEGIDYFIHGSVTQIGDTFTITMKAVDVSTTRIIFSGDISVPRYDIIDYSEKLAAAYVSPYGLGLELYLTPFYHLTSEMSDIEGQLIEGNPIGFSINYRISRNLVTWLGMEATAGMFRLENSFESKSYTNPVNMDPEPEPLPDPIYYKKERTYVAGSIGLGYVFNLSRTFNITLGGEVKLGMSFLHQFYEYEYGEGTEGERIEHELVSQDMTLLMVAPVVKLQYYITPRVALNAAYYYYYQIPRPEENKYFYASTTARKFPQLYNLDPDIDPEGNRHVIDFSGHRVVIGFGFYF